MRFYWRDYILLIALTTTTKGCVAQAQTTANPNTTPESAASRNLKFVDDILRTYQKPSQVNRFDFFADVINKKFKTSKISINVFESSCREFLLGH